MTDKTDIPELRRFNFEIWPHEAYISEQYDGEYVLFADANQQLEAERHTNSRIEAELAALKGDQVPVAWTDAEELRGMEKDGCGYLFKVDPANPFTDPRRQIMLFDRQQKPVISKEKLCDWLEDNFDIDDSQRDAFAKCFAHHCNCIVKKEGE